MKILTAKSFFPLMLALLATATMAQTTPTFKKFTPKENGYYTNSLPSLPVPAKPSTQQHGIPLGAHANDIIALQNARAMQHMGVKPPVAPPSDPVLLQEFMRNQRREYQEAESKRRMHQEVLDDLNERRNDDASREDAFYASERFKADNASYWKAKQQLSDMLAGRTPMSLKDAFYILENAYGNTYLSYEEYSFTLKKSGDFIKQWLNENGHNTRDNQALHFGIQAFMRDTLTVSKLSIEPSGVSKTHHLPFVYDYQDFRAEEDFRNYFVTKTLATGAGQCNSLPAAYLLLAEQLGAKAYLSFAPLHSFIKFPDKAGNMHNYEPTSHLEIADQWYAEHLYISQDAYRNRLYLDTLGNRQIVASAMMDLAFGYMRKNGVADGQFIIECVRDGMPYFPGKASVQGWLLRSAVLANALHRTLEQHSIRDLKDIQKSPQAVEIYQYMLVVEQKLKDLGYNELPTQLYDQLMQQQDVKGRAQKEKHDTKTKRDLFSTFK
jgi:hypothetical protein